MQIPLHTYKYPSKPYKNRSTITQAGDMTQNNGVLLKVFCRFFLFLLQVKHSLPKNHPLMKRLFCILLTAIFVQFLSANQPYHFSHLSVKDGLSQLNVTCIYQDKSGYIWFGTRNGLNKFNGNSFEVYWNLSLIHI